MKKLYFIGTAGSGKSTMVQAFKEWMDLSGLDSIILNLDPGADAVPYHADVDIREWVHLDQVMDEYGLGPNGAQIVSADLMALNTDEMVNILNDFKSDYLLIDTPGQMELFAFRTSSNVIVDAIGRDDSMFVFLSDPALSRTPNGFVSNIMLCALVQFRFSLPVMNVLSKSDTLEEEEIERIRTWSMDPYALYGDLLDDDINSQTVMGLELFKALENIGVYQEIRPASSVESMGMEDIYAMAQMVFRGGDDDQED